MTELSKQPVADRAEHNAFFPSDYSLSQYTAPKTNYAGTKFVKPYTGGKFKVLMVATDERYLQMQNGKFFFHRQPPRRNPAADAAHLQSRL